MTEIFKYLIIDDEPLAAELIKEHASKLPMLEIVDSTYNPLKALEIINNNKIDLIFLDIQMPVLTGIEFLKSLKNPPGVIFTTAYRDYAAESYELDVIDYLVKPITFTRFLQAVNKFINRQSSIPATTYSQENEVKAIDHIYVNANKKYHKIYFKDILYLESLKEYVRIFSKEGNVVTKATMDKLCEDLPINFLRIHRSYIVNTEQITAFTAHDIEIGRIEIPIGGSYKKGVQSFFLK